MSAASAATSLTHVKVLEAPDATAVQLVLDGPSPEVRSFVEGDRLVVELPWVTDHSGVGKISVDDPRASSVEVVEGENKLQVVITAGSATDPFYGRGVAPTDDGLLITVGTAIPGSTAAAGLPAGVATPQSDEPTALTKVDVLDAHHATALQLHLDGPRPKVTMLEEPGPPRLEVLLPGVTNESGAPTIAVGGLRASQVDLVPTVDGLKLVIFAGDTDDPFQGARISNTDVGILVTVGTGQVAATGGAGAATAAAAGAAAAGAATAGAAAAAPVVEPDFVYDPSGPPPLRTDGEQFRISGFEIVYGQPHPDLPPENELLKLDVELGVSANGYVAPREGLPVETVRLIDTKNAPIQHYYASAIRTIDEAIVAEYNRRGMAGVLVIPHEEDIDPKAARDLRTPDRTDLRLVVWVGKLLEARTFASGDRIDEDHRIDAPEHQRIKDLSPVQPGDLLDKQALDEYTARLSRHPGRSVDIALSQAREPGGVYLDYLVAEDRPWSAYAQVSNTGTNETTKWRQRFGFAHNQVTGRDDIFRVDYITGDFDEVQAVYGSYEAPLGPVDRIRGNVGGSYSEYDASEFGFVQSKFHGEQWNAHAQVLANVFQWGDLFVDLIGGLRFDNNKTKNEPFPGSKTTADTNFFFPEVGLRVERVTDTTAVRGFLSTEFNIADVADTSLNEMNEMGRPGLNQKDFKILRWNVFGSAYLEPLFNPSGYDDPSTPATSTMAHEIFLQTRGQYTFGERVIPQYTGVVGGLNSVRGYKQSIATGDKAILGRAEYRFHLPRVLPIEPIPLRLPWIGEFRVAPQQVYGRPDWDLILRAFCDAARTTSAKGIPGEGNNTLVGVGLGVELRIMSHLFVSFDWGHALTEVRNGDKAQDGVKSHSNEYHFLTTLVY